MPALPASAVVVDGAGEVELAFAAAVVLSGDVLADVDGMVPDEDAVLVDDGELVEAVLVSDEDELVEGVVLLELVAALLSTGLLQAASAAATASASASFFMECSPADDGPEFWAPRRQRPRETVPRGP